MFVASIVDFDGGRECEEVRVCRQSNLKGLRKLGSQRTTSFFGEPHTGSSDSW